MKNPPSTLHLPPSTILSTTYFGPVEWYHRLYRADRVLLEACESYTKQTYRNRCVIATTNGPQILTVPVEHHTPLRTSYLAPRTSHIPPLTIKDIRISNHGSWRRVHWNALQSAYSESPFFDYYADDLRPFFERDYEFLFDYNLEIIHTVCQLLDIHPHIGETMEWKGQEEIAGNKDHDDFVARPYWQVFDRKHGFLPNLSILDLLFCKGPEAVFWL